MKKWGSAASVVCGLMLLTPPSVMAQGKVRVAIWEFENNSAQSWWFWNDMGPAARNHIDTAFSENRKLSDKFSVIEREQLALVLKEQGLATSGALDPTTAAKVGQVLGIRYIITGGIDRFSIETTRGGISRFGVGGGATKAEATINVRFIDTTTAERIVALSETDGVTKGGGFFKGASLSRENEWGLASEVIEKTAKALVDKLVDDDEYLARIDTAAGSLAALEGKIIRIQGDRAWINVGATSGVNMGSEIGSGEVTDVQEKFAVITFNGSANETDVIRRK